MEMTAAYGGYWNQLVRAVSVGAENRDLTSFHDAMLHTIQAGVSSMKPGVVTSDFVSSMDRAAKEKGFELTLPMGHFVGLDLVEARVHPQSQQIMKPGTAVIIHPCLSDSSGIRILWGQTYLVSETGTTCMNRAGDELVVVT
jgi:Xaa-Pro aminopeptidase